MQTGAITDAIPLHPPVGRRLFMRPSVPARGPPPCATDGASARAEPGQREFVLPIPDMDYCPVIREPPGYFVIRER
jgi:hypothetical protein